jgi:hypothetical protein
MRAKGRTTKYSTEKINEAIYEYENSDLGWKEIEEKYEIPKATLMYFRKRRKETENAEEN